MGRWDVLMRGRVIAVAGGLALVGLGAAAWELGRRRDERRLEEDPERRILDGSPAETRRSVTTADGVRLHVEEAGPSDAPTVVLVHGWGMSSRFWHYQLRDLPPDLRVVAYDQRGHGGSGGSPDGSYELRALADDLDAVLESCAADGRLPILVGHSLGGMTILAWARDRGTEITERISGAVLIGTSAESVTAGTYAGLALGQRLLNAVGRRAVVSALPTPEQKTPITTRIVEGLALGDEAAPAHVALTEELFFDCPDDVRAALGAVLNDLELDDAIAHLGVPALVIAGSLDRLVPPRFTRRLARELPDARLVEIDGAGHQLPLSRNRRTNELLRRFALRTHQDRSPRGS